MTFRCSPSPYPPGPGPRGFTLIEVLLGIVLLSVIFLAVTDSVLQGKKMSGYTRDRIAASNIASTVMDALCQASCKELADLQDGKTALASLANRFSLPSRDGDFPWTATVRLSRKGLYDMVVEVTSRQTSQKLATRHMLTACKPGEGGLW